MAVYIVLRNGKVDEVFTTFEAAQARVDELTRKWDVAHIIRKTVIGS